MGQMGFGARQKACIARATVREGWSGGRLRGWEPARAGFIGQHKEPGIYSNYSSHSAAPPVFFLPSPHNSGLPPLSRPAGCFLGVALEQM